MRRNPTDITGLRFGRLIAIEEDRTRSRRLWRCRCDCGRTKLFAKLNLIKGGTRSCGCFMRETMRAWALDLPRPEAP